MSSADLESRYSEKAVRQIFWKYPQGKAILAYLLSLMDSEETDKPKFSWFEQAHAHAESLTLLREALVVVARSVYGFCRSRFPGCRWVLLDLGHILRCLCRRREQVPR